MAKTATKREPKPGNKRYRRTPEEQIADLKAQIEKVKSRAAAKKAKASPELKHTLEAVRQIDKALETAKDRTHRSALSESRDALAGYLKLEGLPMPKRRGPRRKSAGE